MSLCPPGFPNISVNVNRCLCISSLHFHTSIIQELGLINHPKQSARENCVELICVLHQNKSIYLSVVIFTVSALEK